MRKYAIIEVFQEVGRATTARLARECIDRGIFTDDELRTASVRWAQSVCREALKETDPRTGLPYAGPTQTKTEDGAPLWQQLTFMDYENLAFNIEIRSNGIMADYEVLRHMRNYCLDRFGRAPEIFELRVLETV